MKITSYSSDVDKKSGLQPMQTFAGTKNVQVSERGAGKYVVSH